MTPDAISTLTDGELKGWWLCVMVWRIQSERDGERAALMDRARVLGINLNSLPLNDRAAINDEARGASNTPALLDITRTKEVQDHAR